MCFGAPQPRCFAFPEKKHKRADLAGGERFWAGTHTVLQYDISWFFLGLGTWLLTVTGIETLILTLIHPSLYINTHTSISISNCYSYLNIKYIDLSLCGSSPSLRQFRLKRAVASIECENTTAAWVKTMTELVIEDLEPPSKWNSSDAVKNRSEMKTNEVIVW